jgi:hypothetical protein
MGTASRENALGKIALSGVAAVTVMTFGCDANVSHRIKRPDAIQAAAADAQQADQDADTERTQTVVVKPSAAPKAAASAQPSTESVDEDDGDSGASEADSGDDSDGSDDPAAAPSLAFAATTFQADYGVALSVAPSELSDNGAAITDCKVLAGSANAQLFPSSWLTIDPSTCVLSGTPGSGSELPATTFTIVASNAAGQSAPASVTLSVDDHLPDQIRLHMLGFVDCPSLNGDFTLTRTPGTTQWESADIYGPGQTQSGKWKFYFVGTDVPTVGLATPGRDSLYYTDDDSYAKTYDLNPASFHAEGTTSSAGNINASCSTRDDSDSMSWTAVPI